MYICICNALKDKDLAAAATDADNVADVFKKCGRRPQCGKCLTDVADIIEASQTDAGARPIVAAE